MTHSQYNLSTNIFSNKLVDSILEFYYCMCFLLASTGKLDLTPGHFVSVSWAHSASYSASKHVKMSTIISLCQKDKIRTHFCLVLALTKSDLGFQLYEF